jgi:ketosteroid isomerase-like protein
MADTQDTPNVAAVKGFLERQYAGDIEGAFAAHARPEFTWVVGMVDDGLRSAIPWAGRRHRGLDGYRDLIGGLFGEYAVEAFEPRRFHDTGGAVFVEGYFRFRHRGTGKLAESDFVGRFDMAAGRVAGGQFYENTWAVAAGRTP